MLSSSAEPNDHRLCREARKYMNKEYKERLGVLQAERRWIKLNTDGAISISN
ncbi:hypothetical protein Gorai_002124, partial [Gossypium raimondii]|nr:hypothetical protein [Gossypium raimondii]